MIHDIIKAFVLAGALFYTIDITTTVLSWYSPHLKPCKLIPAHEAVCAVLWTIFYYLCYN